MQLFPKEIHHLLPAEVDYENENLIAPIKFFSPACGWEWYPCAAKPWGRKDILFTGFVIGFEREFGDFTLSQLREFRAERNWHFQPIYLFPLMNEGVYRKVDVESDVMFFIV